MEGLEAMYPLGFSNSVPPFPVLLFQHVVSSTDSLSHWDVSLKCHLRTKEQQDFGQPECFLEPLLVKCALL